MIRVTGWLFVAIGLEVGHPDPGQDTVPVRIFARSAVTQMGSASSHQRRSSTARVLLIANLTPGMASSVMLLATMPFLSGRSPVTMA